MKKESRLGDIDATRVLSGRIRGLCEKCSIHWNDYPKPYARCTQDGCPMEVELKRIESGLDDQKL